MYKDIISLNHKNEHKDAEKEAKKIAKEICDSIINDMSKESILRHTVETKNMPDDNNYYMGSYQKPIYICEPCGLRLTTGDNKETEPCPLCGELIKMELVQFTFLQKYNYVTTSC
ncbi:hypothetical protein LCGC14_1029690 [marine sediment metagenome]|uniref:Uncharacterized protein n=1 Tax=marine sediment metagenome TaxID=412755 RepID=A0A0F9NGR2_9ZZZZ